MGRLRIPIRIAVRNRTGSRLGESGYWVPGCAEKLLADLYDCRTRHAHSEHLSQLTENEFIGEDSHSLRIVAKSYNVEFVVRAAHEM